LAKVYKNYVYAKETNKLNAKLDATIEIISAKLKNRLKNSVIVTKYPLKLTDNLEAKVDFKSIALLEDNDTEYKILEWIGIDYEAKNGIWDDRENHIQTGWSGFIDLGYNSHQTNSETDDYKEFNVTTLDSNFTIVKLIDQNITTSYGFNQDPFESNTTTLIFSGVDLDGDIVDDLNHSYGWYKNDSTREAKAVFAIQSYKEYLNNNSPAVDINITSITKNDGENKLFARYYLTRSAYAIVPIESNVTLDDGRKINDYNLTFVYNYQPWQGDWWNGSNGKDGSGKGEANRTLIATHVTEVRFKKDLDTQIIRLYICIQSPDVEVNSTRNLTLCKEKAIY
jgi:hypothetical protein